MAKRTKPRAKPARKGADKTTTKSSSKRETAEAQAERLAAMLADAPTSGTDPLSPPAFVADKRLKHALVTWNDLAATLDQRGCLTKLDRQVFALFCYYRAEFIEAADDILTKGYSMLVPTIAKGKDGKTGEMYRTNPSVDRRDHAADMMMDLSKRFGLTPLDRLTLFRVEKSSNDPGLFDNPNGKPPQAPEDQLPKDNWTALLDGPQPPPTRQ